MKERLDVLLVKRGLFQSRERAKGAIMAGTVFVNGQRVDKPGMSIPRMLKLRLEVRRCLCQPGRFEAGQGTRGFCGQGARQNSCGRWGIYRRLH